MIGEYAIVIGAAQQTTFVPISSTYGNIIITGCRFYKMGVEKGPVYLRDSAGMTYTRIIASNNIGTELSPILLDTTFEVIQQPTLATLTNIQEVSNCIEV
jgi:hypothetical protein